MGAESKQDISHQETFPASHPKFDISCESLASLGVVVVLWLAWDLVKFGFKRADF